MKYNIRIVPCLLRFRQPAGTSRGYYTVRNVWYLIVSDPSDSSHVGIGECAPLPDLSCDASPDYAKVLSAFCSDFAETGKIDYHAMANYPSMLFGLESALRHYEAGSVALWDTPFSRGEAGIPINGLVWMGDYVTMLSRIDAKISEGYKCIKLKIGAIDFESEVSLIEHIRSVYPPDMIELRVDANGAFNYDDVMGKLERLASYGIHSIEQPIKAGQWDKMASVVRNSPIPVALDEELIGINDIDRKKKLLDIINPDYIILKPTLHGGIYGSEEWIAEAGKRGIGWWITSAIESNIGLNAIAQWASTHNLNMPQGLGTGLLFTDNVRMPLEIRNNALWFTGRKPDGDILNDIWNLI